jgi:hypothetical protein
MDQVFCCMQKAIPNYDKFILVITACGSSAKLSDALHANKFSRNLPPYLRSIFKGSSVVLETSDALGTKATINSPNAPRQPVTGKSSYIPGYPH